jgi:hypothetical protein
MSKPKTLLEDLCEHALSCGAESIEVEYKDHREWVFARKGDIAFIQAAACAAGALADARVVPRFCGKCSDVAGYAPSRGLRVHLPQGA